MVLALKKVSKYGTKHPVVARLKLQTHEFVQWANLRTDKREEVVGVYFDMAERFIKCHDVYE